MITDPNTRRLAIELLRALSMVQQSDEHILIATAKLTTGATDADLRIALAVIEGKQWAVVITTPLGSRKWSLTDLGRAILADL